jgi:hypothetical protein
VCWGSGTIWYQKSHRRRIQNLSRCERIYGIHGVEVIDLNLDECEKMMSEFIETNPELWNEDIGK